VRGGSTALNRLLACASGFHGSAIFHMLPSSLKKSSRSFLVDCVRGLVLGRAVSKKLGGFFLIAWSRDGE
jgi:hypothetical protein